MLPVRKWDTTADRIGLLLLGFILDFTVDCGAGVKQVGSYFCILATEHAESLNYIIITNLHYIKKFYNLKYFYQIFLSIFFFLVFVKQKDVGETVDPHINDL